MSQNYDHAKAKNFLDFGFIKTTALPVQARGRNFTGIHCNVFVKQL
jgi:hypothetical protein